MTTPNTNDSAILVATRNPGKIAEFGQFLADLGLSPVGLDRFDPLDDVVETGSTFVENARLKARGYALQTQMISVADDSGLEVAALDNRPGVRSARYGREGTTSQQRIAKLLDELHQTGDHERRARFVCSLAIADACGEIVFTADGVCDGKIAREPRGTGGFGYDPIFIPDGYDLTFGELPGDIKQKIGHRGRAFGQIVPFLRGFLSIST